MLIIKLLFIGTMYYYITVSFILFILDGFARSDNGYTNNTNTTTPKQHTNNSFHDNGGFHFNIQTVVNYGGAGLSLLCFIFSMAFFCCFRSICKRLKRLEQLYEKNKRKSLNQNTLKHQGSNVSNISNAPTDIDTIPIVSRRSEYIRNQRNQRMASVAKELRTRVSRFIFGSRSSADTFDLSDREEPIYDDITQYRPKIGIDEQQDYICCCCCRISSDYTAADTSDSQTKEKNGGTPDEPGRSEIITTITKEEIEQITNCNEQIGSYATHKKDKKQTTANTTKEIKVQHVDFDINEKIIQPTTSDDITIDVVKKPVKQVNTENQLYSFGRKRAINQPLDNSPKRENKKLVSPILPQKTDQKSNTLKPQKKKIVGGIQLPTPVPLKPAKSMPSVFTAAPKDGANADTDEDEKERDPSYIDMSETLRKS